MNTRPYKHIFFDLDHTLWDFEKNTAQALSQIWGDFGGRLPGSLHVSTFYQHFRKHHLRLWNQLQRSEIRGNAWRWKRFWFTLLDFQLADRELSQAMDQAFREQLPYQRHLIPYAREVLDYLSPRYSLHLLTNGWERMQRQKVRSSGIEGYFKQLICSEIALSRKPNPEIYIYAQKLAGASPDSSLMIGDRYDIDVLGARNAGWGQIHFNPKKTRNHPKPSLEISCLSELMDLL